MIKNFKKFILESSYDRYPIEIDGVVYDLKVDKTDVGTRVYLEINGSLYDEISIIIPATKTISDDEFFLNPKAEKNIIRQLEVLGIIEKLDRLENAGGVETPLYFIS